MKAVSRKWAFAAGRLAELTFLTLITIFVLAPIVAIVIVSFDTRSYVSFPPGDLGWRWYIHLINTPRWIKAIYNTFAIGVPVAIIATILGTASAIAISKIPKANALSALFLAPLTLPHVVLAIGLYPTFIRLNLTDTFSAVVFAHIIVATPFVFLSVTASLQNYNHSLELAAMTLGADERTVLWRVTLPMIKNGVISGALLAFATSFDELMLSLFTTTNRTETLPILIWQELFFMLTPAIAAGATLILCTSMILLTIWFFVSGIGASTLDKR